MKNRTKILTLAVLTVLMLATVFTVVLASSTVTVSFYDGGKLVAENGVLEGGVPTAPETNEIVVIDGVGYRLIGWSTTEGGEASELTAVTEAAAFYAVREAVEFKVEGADGTVTWYKPGETTLSNLMVNATAGDYITACSDTAITGTAAVHCTKSFTLDLNGNTLSTDYYLVPNKSTHVKICNGTVNVTKQPLAQTWRDRNGAAVIELCDLTVKKTDATVATYFLDVQIGTAILDNVTVAADEWNVPSSSTYFIRAGYKTKTEVQDVNITVKNSNFDLPEISFISAGGASSETNGYNLHVDIKGSTVITDKYIVNFAPPSATAAKCKLDVKISEKSVIDAGGFSAEIAFNFGSGVLDENVTVWADYGVEFSRYPKLSVGTLKLGIKRAAGKLPSCNPGNKVEVMRYYYVAFVYSLVIDYVNSYPKGCIRRIYCAFRISKAGNDILIPSI